MKRMNIWRGLAAAVIAVAGSQFAIANTNSLPMPHQTGPVTYLSGGVGLDESQSIKKAMSDYPLVLEFSGKTSSGNEYLSDIPVKIVNAHGDTVLQTNASGPFLLAKLPPGRYTVDASYQGETQHRSFDLSVHGHVKEFFLWKM